MKNRVAEAMQMLRDGIGIDTVRIKTGYSLTALQHMQQEQQREQDERYERNWGKPRERKPRR